MSGNVNESLLTCCAEADKALAEGRTRPMSVVLAEMAESARGRSADVGILRDDPERGSADGCDHDETADG